MSAPSPATAWIRIGLLALPIYGLLVGYTTRKPQPDLTSDPEGWSRFVSSPSYLAEHVAGNVLGALLVIFGTLALGAFLVRHRAPRLALWGMVLAMAGQILFMVPGTISTFGTPPIGTAYLAGNRDVMALEFSSAVDLIVVLALLLTLVGNILLGLAVWRSGVLPKWAGGLWIVATLVFYVLGAALGMATTNASLITQPIGGLLLAISGGWIAWAVLRHGSARRSV